jgi:hypothetical protein
MTERHIDESAVGETLSRRSLVAGAAFFGAAMAAIGEVAKAHDAGSGSYSNAAIALPDAESAAKAREEANPRRQDRTRHARGAPRHYGERDDRRDG